MYVDRDDFSRVRSVCVFVSLSFWQSEDVHDHKNWCQTCTYIFISVVRAYTHTNCMHTFSTFLWLFFDPWIWYCALCDRCRRADCLNFYTHKSDLFFQFLFSFRVYFPPHLLVYERWPRRNRTTTKKDCTMCTFAQKLKRGGGTSFNINIISHWIAMHVERSTIKKRTQNSFMVKCSKLVHWLCVLLLGRHRKKYSFSPSLKQQDAGSSRQHIYEKSNKRKPWRARKKCKWRRESFETSR